MAPNQVLFVAWQEEAIPIDIPGVELIQRGPRCSFDAFLGKYSLEDPALHVLSKIIRDAGIDSLQDSTQVPG